MVSNEEYTPVFKSEEDFLKLLKKPSPQVICFKDAVDDIYANSFVFRSFRNEFETDNLFNANSIQLIKDGAIDFNSTERPTDDPPPNLYIPGYRVQSFLPSRSELTKPQMKACFQMYLDICNNRNLNEAKLAIYNKYHEIIQKEQRLFQEIAKNTWVGINSRRASEIRPEIQEYTTKLWKKRLERISWYPKHYKKHLDISLIDDSGKKSELTFTKLLKSLGNILPCYIPYLRQKRHTIFSDEYYFENSEDNSDTFRYYKRIHSTLLANDYHPDVSKDKLAESLAIESNADIVISGSGFLCLLDNHSDVSTRSWELPVVVKEHVKGLSKKKVVYIDKVFPSKSLTAVERIKWFCKKKMPDMLLIGRKSVDKKRMEEVVTYGDLDEFSRETSYDISKLENFGIDANNSDKMKVTSPRKRQRSRSPDSDNNSHNASFTSIDEDVMDSDQEKNSFFSPDSENELIIDTDDDPPQESSVKVTEEEKSSIKNNILPKQKKVKVKERKLLNKIIYNLWSMKSDSANVLLKSNLKDLNVLIRCKEGVNIKKQLYSISTKLEYQPEFGAEVTTLSEITRDWGNVLIRPACHLLRVRLDALTGEFIMYEKKTIHDLTIEFQRQHSKTPYNKLSSLHAIFGQLSDLSPGHYLLSHSPENGLFAQLYKEEKSKHTYNSNLGYIQVDCSSVAPSKASWLQIDQMVITPTCAHFYRIPALFHPKVTRCSSKLEVSSADMVEEVKAKITLKRKRKRHLKKLRSIKKKVENKNTEPEKEELQNPEFDDKEFVGPGFEEN